MEDKLKETYSPSIKKNLWYFLLFAIGYAAVLVCCILIWNQINCSVYDSLLDQFMEVDDTFQTIDSAGQMLEQYVYSMEETDYKAASDLVAICQNKVENLAGLELLRENGRSVADMSGMIKSYLDSMERIRASILKNGQKNEDTVWMTRSSEEYVRAETILSYLLNERDGLYKDALTQIKAKRSLLQTQSKRFFLQISAICLFLLAFGSIWAFRLADSILYPIAVLCTGAQKIASGSLEQISLLSLDENRGKNEISFLIDVFNLMLTRIQDQISDLQQTAQMKRCLLEQEVETLKVRAYLKSSELKRMQTQINSHFLFNTLSMITQTAYMENADETVELMECTANFLRYSLSSGDKKVPLARELEELGNYIFIQEKRFSGRIRFIFRLDETHHELRVPALILQPIVENSIVHGLGMCREDGWILIETGYEKQERGLWIRISDNGVGIEKEKLISLQKKLKNPKEENGHIGLINVAKRLQLQENYRSAVMVESRPGEGTCIEIRLLERPENLPERLGEGGLYV